MERSSKFMQWLTDSMDLPEAPVPGLPIVELAGDMRVLIEGHCGVSEYSRERIGVKVSYGLVCVMGCGLDLIRMSRERLVIRGRIDQVQIHRRCP